MSIYIKDTFRIVLKILEKNGLNIWKQGNNSDDCIYCSQLQ